MEVSGVTYLETFVRFSLKPFVETVVAAAGVAFNALDSVGTGVWVTDRGAVTAGRDAMVEFTLPLLPQSSEVVIRRDGRNEVRSVLGNGWSSKDDVTRDGVVSRWGVRGRN